MLLAQKVVVRMVRERLSDQAFRVCCGAGKILASFRRFWAVAARRNSSFAPHGPRNRSRPKPRMRLRCAKSISTFPKTPLNTRRSIWDRAERALRPKLECANVCCVFLVSNGHLAQTSKCRVKIGLWIGHRFDGARRYNAIPTAPEIALAAVDQ